MPVNISYKSLLQNNLQKVLTNEFNAYRFATNNMAKAYWNIRKGSLGSHMVIHRRKRRFEPNENKGKALAESRADLLREEATDAEKHLLNALDAESILYWFQHPHSYRGKIAIVDFAFPRANKETRLYVEIDGGYHLTDNQKEKDAKRTLWLMEHSGAEIIRFTNEQVLNDVDSVVQTLKNKRVQLSNKTIVSEPSAV